MEGAPCHNALPLHSLELYRNTEELKQSFEAELRSIESVTIRALVAPSVRHFPSRAAEERDTSAGNIRIDKATQLDGNSILCADRCKTESPFC
jgi:hypothetical protein